VTKLATLELSPTDFSNPPPSTPANLEAQKTRLASMERELDELRRQQNASASGTGEKAQHNEAVSSGLRDLKATLEKSLQSMTPGSEADQAARSRIAELDTLIGRMKCPGDTLSIGPDELAERLKDIQRQKALIEKMAADLGMSPEVESQCPADAENQRDAIQLLQKLRSDIASAPSNVRSSLTGAIEKAAGALPGSTVGASAKAPGSEDNPFAGGTSPVAPAEAILSPIVQPSAEPPAKPWYNGYPPEHVDKYIAETFVAPGAPPVIKPVVAPPAPEARRAACVPAAQSPFTSLASPAAVVGGGFPGAPQPPCNCPGGGVAQANALGEAAALAGGASVPGGLFGPGASSSMMAGTTRPVMRNGGGASASVPGGAAPAGGLLGEQDSFDVAVANKLVEQARLHQRGPIGPETVHSWDNVIGILETRPTTPEVKAAIGEARARKAGHVSKAPIQLTSLAN